ncbi:MAG: rod shape-determining protein RodA [Oscillatoriales cyanobacterium RM1_1_9]|nr:rod shape-determining protein RodA [Oscillatoriales cyanobacterium SM2_3_0]NJO47191.1 rod shape-determining protein RodA [Oscillatoriales cyanobacterium RM2_1_1]NJO70577.1 rod shape-determining protein RodA [Oscillatoriales cyanobacterium RM1_1_9]
MLGRIKVNSRRRPLLSAWAEVDWPLFWVYTGLTLFGGLMIRSVELNQGLTDWWQHWLMGGIGLAIALGIACYRYDRLIQWKWVIYGVVNISLIAVHFIGTSALGAQRWINILGFHVQPSEFAKVGLIITLAVLLHERTTPTLLDMARMLAIAAVPWGLVFIEPNLGTSLIFGAITLGMLYWGNVPPSWLVLLVSPMISAILFNVQAQMGMVFALAMGMIGWWSLPRRWLSATLVLLVNFGAGKLGHFFWGLLQDYQKQRLTGFLNPENDPLGAGYHLIQSRIAIGSGQLYGRGLYHGTQTQLDFIPEQHTDFIFSAIGEELGFIGCMVVLSAFWFICWRLILIALSAKDSFGSLLAIGVLCMVVFQVFVNIGMNIGLAPVTGIPLPLLSYGRSALLSNFIALGLVQSVANHRQRVKF